MLAIKFTLVAALLIVGFQEIRGHGKLMDPVNRSSAWRKKFRTPPNYTDNQNFCGGFDTQYLENGGKCGPCGDNYRDPQPRENENGGVYGTGIVVKTYKKGERITVSVNLSANHKGYFQFAVCPLKSANDVETEECFEKHPVKLANGSDRFLVQDGVDGNIGIDVVLPTGLTCERCTFRWHYRTGNRWGYCDDGRRGENGCGPQEIFRSCSDVTIL